jgi:hypothetical protein
MASTATIQIFGSLEAAYAHFNHSLFDGQLPEVVFALSNKGRSVEGYFLPNKFSGRSEKAVRDEIALNPLHFDQPLRNILANLAHQMTHVWLHYCSHPSRAGYHNRHWADMMIAIGLQPSSTGKPGGAETGQRVSHYIVPDGRFDVECNRLIAAGFEPQWKEATASKGKSKPTRKPRSPGRVRWCCKHCDQKAWAKPSATLVCGECQIPLQSDA